jgi:Ca2+-transporting ATPase
MRTSDTVSDNEVSPIGDWHRLDVDTALADLGSSLDGLESDEIVRRRDAVGPNELQESAGTSKLALIWGQISSVMVLILIGAAVLSLLLGKYLEAGAIGAIVVLFTALGF